MRSDRKGYPTSLKPFVKKGFPNRGDYRSARNGNLLMVLWQDTKAISCVSTNVEDNITQISKKQRDGSTLAVNCPESIATYNKKMGGVDLNDQLRGYYNIRIKSKKFYKYLFFATLDVVITNSYILSKFFPDIKTKNLKDFRQALAKELIGQYNSRKRRGRPSLQQSMKHFCSSHFPTKAERRGNRCHFCAHYLGKRGETVRQCKDCNLFLCHTGKEDDCFYIYHTKYGPTVHTNDTN